MLVSLGLTLPSEAGALECPNCALEFPSSWQVEELAGGLRVELEGQEILVHVQQDEILAPLGSEDVEDEEVWLRDELQQAGLELESSDGTVLRTAAREPAAKILFSWRDQDGATGTGLRLVRRCGVRVIFEQRADEIRLDVLLQVSDRVRYTHDPCTKYNADVIPVEVLESDIGTRVQEIEIKTSPAEPLVVDPDVELQATQPVAGCGSGLGLVLIGSVVGLLVMLGLMLRSGGSNPLNEVAALRSPRRPVEPSEPAMSELTAESAPSLAAATDEGPATEQPELDLGPGSLGRTSGAAVDEQEEEDPFAAHLGDPDEDLGMDFDDKTDGFPLYGTYGIRGTGGGGRERVSEGGLKVGVEQREEPPGSDQGRLLDEAGSQKEAAQQKELEKEGDLSVGTEEFAVPRPSGVPEEPYTLAAALASLGKTMWQDFTAPGFPGVAFLPAVVAQLLQEQNGGRYGYGWLLLLGLRRKNMDLMTLNGDARIKARFGSGWLVGVFAFGDVLWVGDDQKWYVQRLDGRRSFLGADAMEAIRNLADSAELRDAAAEVALVERCREAVGELLPGWVYRVRDKAQGHGRLAAELVEVVAFLDLLEQEGRPQESDGGA